MLCAMSTVSASEVRCYRGLVVVLRSSTLVLQGMIYSSCTSQPPRCCPRMDAKRFVRSARFLFVPFRLVGRLGPALGDSIFPQFVITRPCALLISCLEMDAGCVPVAAPGRACILFPPRKLARHKTTRVHIPRVCPPAAMANSYVDYSFFLYLQLSCEFCVFLCWCGTFPCCVPT